MHAIRQSCRPKHQVLVLKCYPRITKGAVDVKPNSSELSYLLFYATTRRSKVQKVGAFLEKKTASDVWRSRIGNVQVTLQILATLIEKAPRDLPLYAPYVLNILSQVLRSRDISMVEASILTFASFCEHHDGASLSADQEYSTQYAEIVKMYAAFASTRPMTSKSPMSAPLAIRWRRAGLQAVKSVASSEALASVAGRQLDVVVPVLLESISTDDGDLLDTLEQRAQVEDGVGVERAIKRRGSTATVKTVKKADKQAATGSIAAADKLAEEDTAVLAMQCLKQIFVVNNRSQIYSAIQATLNFIDNEVALGKQIIGDHNEPGCKGWAIRLFDIIAQWTPVQDRFVILVMAMDTLMRSPMAESNLRQQLVLAWIVDSLLSSDINLVGLSVMDVLLGLIQHVLKTLQLGGVQPYQQQRNSLVEECNVSGEVIKPEKITLQVTGNVSPVASDLRKHLLARLQLCIGHLANHVYYADQISDMVSAILLRLKPPKTGVIQTSSNDIPVGMRKSQSSGEQWQDNTTDGFLSLDTAKVKALEAIKSILLVANKQHKTASDTGRNRVPIRVWEGTQWLLRHREGKIRKAYVDALLTWLERETGKSDMSIQEEKSPALKRSSRDESTINLPKRAASTAPSKERAAKSTEMNFLPLLHLAIYENAHEYVHRESDVVLLHLLLSKLVQRLGVNAARIGLPMIYRLQEDIVDVETPKAKIRFGSLCHGYFWALSERFDFANSPVSRIVQMEIMRRRKKSFWVNRICMPPVAVAQIEIPGPAEPPSDLALEVLESESLKPFDERFQMVKLISLSYADSWGASPPSSPGATPSRVLTQPILIADARTSEVARTMPASVKDQMMSEWTKESVLARVQARSKTVSLNGSQSGTMNTARRNFLAVSGMTQGSNSGTNSPKDPPVFTNEAQRSRPTSTYGLVGGVGPLGKVRKGSTQSPSPASESSRKSATRIEQLKRILSGQQNALPATRDPEISDSSSESMVSYNYPASELSFNLQEQHNGSTTHRSAPLQRSNEKPRTRSRSRERASSDHGSIALKPHTANPTKSEHIGPLDTLDDGVPPVPPLPTSLAREGTTVLDYGAKDSLSNGQGLKRAPNGEQVSPEAAGGAPWAGDTVRMLELQDMVKSIETNADNQLDVSMKPPY